LNQQVDDFSVYKIKHVMFIQIFGM